MFPVPLYSLFALLLSVVLMMSGAGALTTVLSVRLDGAGVSAGLIGLTTTAYFAGTIFGSVTAGRAVSRVGHIRAFAVFTSLLSAATLGHVLTETAVGWGILRVVEGYCMAGLLICVESWLNQTAQAGNRGKILALYMICLYGGYGAGQFLLGLPGMGGAAMFAVLSICLSVALVPVALTRQTPPPLPQMKSFSIRKLYAVSPFGVVGAGASGAMTGTLYGLGPVFALKLGYDAEQAGQFMSAAVLGGVLLQWPLGWLSDLFDRRTVLVGLFAALVCAGLGAALLPDGAFSAVLVAAVFLGGLTFAVYPVSIAQTNDHLEPDDMAAAGGGLILLYSAGAAIGPFLASTAMEQWGAVGLPLFSCVIAGGAALFGVWRMRVQPCVPAQEQGPFTAMPRTTPMVVSLDPRVDQDSVMGVTESTLK